MVTGYKRLLFVESVFVILPLDKIHFLLPCSDFLLLAVINHSDQKQLRRRKDLFGLNM